MSHSVVFELPELVEADAFALAVGVSVLDAARLEGDTWLVAVMLSPDPTHLAATLRRAEEWVAARGLGGIRFHLDGRSYVLWTDDAVLSEAA
jgi:hypothetical protein